MNSKTLTTRKILVFWFPLLLTWLMMAIEGPYIAAIIARLPAEKSNLAAFGVSFSFALVIEAPVIMLMSATIALTKGPCSFKKLRRFTGLLNLSVVGINLIVLIPPIFNLITQTLIGLSPEIAKLVYWTTVALIPWPPAIGYRRFYQGLLIQNYRTRMVTLGTIFRLFSMAVTAWTLARFSNLPGSVTGGLALSAGVSIESLMTRVLARSTRQKVLGKPPESSILSYKMIFSFYYPLALTSMISLSVRPAMVFFLGQSRMALETLAVLPVINALLFIFSAIGLSFQEVGVALMGENLEFRNRLTKFSIKLGLFVAFMYGIIVLTPVSRFWFHTVSGLSNDLTQFALFPAQLLLLMPFLSVFLSFQRSLMVNLKTTGRVSTASAMEVIGILVTLALVIHSTSLVGAIAASLAITTGRLAAVGYLAWRSPTDPLKAKPASLEN